MNNKATIIIDGFHGRLESEFIKVYEEGKNKKQIIKNLKEQFLDILEHEFKELGKTLNDFEFVIYEDITEKYSN
jgi:hypothetical protein